MAPEQEIRTDEALPDTAGEPEPSRGRTVWRIFKPIAIFLIVLGLIGGAGFYYAWKWHNGPALANRLAKNYNKKYRGRMTIGSVKWTPRAALDILLGRDHKVTIYDISLYDTKGRRVAHFPEIEAWGKLWPLIRHGSFEVTRAEAERGDIRIDYYKRPDGPDPLSHNPFEVGLLGALEPSDYEKSRKEAPSVYNFNHMHVKRLSVSYYHRRFQIHFKRIGLEGSLFVSSATPTTPTRVSFDVHPKGGEGELRVAGKTLQLADITAPYVRSDPDSPHDLELAVGGRVAGARFRMTSRIERLIQAKDPSIQLSATFTRFAGLLAKLSGLDLRGADEKLALDVDGPLSNTTTRLRLSGLSARLQAGGRKLRVDDLFGRAHLKGGKLSVRTLTGQTLSGSVAARGTLDLSRMTFKSRLQLSGLSVTSLLDSRSRKRLLGGKVYGKLALNGTLDPRTLSVPSLDVTLQRRSRGGPLPRRLRLRGRGSWAGDTIKLGRLSLSGFGLSLAARGTIGVRSRKLKLALNAEISRLNAFLRSAGLPALARAGALNGQLRGTAGSPRLYGELSLKGVGYKTYRSQRIASTIAFVRGALSFEKLRGDLLGGLITGEGRLGLFHRGTWRLRNRPFVKAKLKLAGGSLHKLLPRRNLKGRFVAQVSVKGRTGALTGKGYVRLVKAVISGQRIRSGEVRLCLKRRRVELEKIAMTWGGGGRLAASGRYGLSRGGLAFRGTVSELPLSVLSDNPAFRRMLSGALSGKFDISGDRARPVIAAVLKLARVRMRGVLLGDRGRGEVKLKPAGGVTRIDGTLFEKFRISGQLLLQPEPTVRLSVRFDKLPVHELIPELADLPAEVTAIATGSLELDFGLSSGIRKLQGTLTSLDLKLKQTDNLPGEKPKVVDLRNAGPIRLAFDGEKLYVKQLKLQGATGTVAATGWLSARDSRLRVKGQLEVGSFAFLLTRWLDDLRGRVFVDATVRGPLLKPKIDSKLTLAGVRILMPDRRVPIRIAAADLELTNDLLRIKRARVAVHTDEVAVKGTIALRDFGPKTLDLRVHGKLSAQIIRLALPRTFSHVSGRARASLSLTGSPKRPNVTGLIRLEPMSFTLRGSGREFAVKSGAVKIYNEKVYIKEVRGTVDDGTFVVDGRVKLLPKWPYDMSLTIQGQGIPVKKARSYELELNTKLKLVVAVGKASISGYVDVADGRFTETFDVVSSAFLKRRTNERRKPFWETNELLRDAKLNVTVATRGPLDVKNNLADIRLEGNITLTGTPLKPKFGGRIAAESGTFRIPFLRGQFSVRSGELDFDHPFGFGETYVKIVGETNYTDTSETEHDITVSLEGPLSRIAIKLSSSSGLNQSQILMLLASGRTMDQLRKQMRGGASGPGNTSRSSNPLDAYDSSLKQVTGDFLSQLVAKPLQAWTRLDLVRLEMGTESFQVRVNKRLGRNVRLAGEAEFGLMGRQRQEGRIEVRVHDNVTADAKARRLIPGDDTVIEEDRYQGRIELKYKIRLRTGLRRSLGF